jgi:RimJ/RimL family protein N-acetyltransferase
VAHVSLQPAGEEHVAALGALLSDPDIQRFTRIPVPVPETFAGEWIGRYLAEEDKQMFAVLGENDAFAGIGLAMSIDRHGGEAELGYLVDPALRGRGLGTAALERLTRWALEEEGLHRVELRIDVTNTPSLAVARRCGYFHEGTLRSTWLKDGFPRVDLTIWSRLRTD